MFNFEDSFFSKKHSVLLSFLVFLMIFALTAVSLIACSSDSSDSVMDKTGALIVNADNLSFEDSKGLNVIVSNNVATNGTGAYYWRYTAVKKDSYGKTGEKTAETAINGGTGGLPAKLSNMAAGKWEITLYGYLTTGYANADIVYQSEPVQVEVKANATNNIMVSVHRVQKTGTKGKLVIDPAQISVAFNSGTVAVNKTYETGEDNVYLDGEAYVNMFGKLSEYTYKIYECNEDWSVKSTLINSTADKAANGQVSTYTNANAEVGTHYIKIEVFRDGYNHAEEYLALMQVEVYSNSTTTIQNDGDGDFSGITVKRIKEFRVTYYNWGASDNLPFTGKHGQIYTENTREDGTPVITSYTQVHQYGRTEVLDDPEDETGNTGFAGYYTTYNGNVLWTSIPAWEYQDIKLYAKWDVKKYASITWNDNFPVKAVAAGTTTAHTGGSSSTADAGTVPVMPTDPAAVGYIFKGWFIDGAHYGYTNVNGLPAAWKAGQRAECVAQWEPIHYYVQVKLGKPFTSGGGTVAINASNVTNLAELLEQKDYLENTGLDYDEEYTIIDAITPGYGFIGYHKDTDEYEEGNMYTDPILKNLTTEGRSKTKPLVYYAVFSDFFTPLEYIRSNAISSSKPYISTLAYAGTTSDKVARVVIDFELAGTNMVNEEYIMGNYQDNSHQRDFEFNVNKRDGYWKKIYWNGSGVAGDSFGLYFEDERYVVDYTENGSTHTIKIDGEEVWSRSGLTNFNSNQDIALFATRNAPDNYNTSMRLYSCLMYNSSGNVVRRFQPCVLKANVPAAFSSTGVDITRTSDTEIGLWDLKTNKYYPNRGTGRFYQPSEETSVIFYANYSGANIESRTQKILKQSVYSAGERLHKNLFNRPNSTFLGWGDSPSATVNSYEDADVKVIKTNNSISLYARWTNPVSYHLFAQKDWVGSTGAEYINTQSTLSTGKKVRIQYLIKGGVWLDNTFSNIFGCEEGYTTNNTYAGGGVFNPFEDGSGVSNGDYVWFILRSRKAQSPNTAIEINLTYRYKGSAAGISSRKIGVNVDEVNIYEAGFTTKGDIFYNSYGPDGLLKSNLTQALSVAFPPLKNIYGFYLFADNLYGTTARFCIGKIYSYQLINLNTNREEANFVPCVLSVDLTSKTEIVDAAHAESGTKVKGNTKTSNGKDYYKGACGFWDLVTDRFFGDERQGNGLYVDEDNYLIRYDGNGGLGTVDDQKITSSTSYVRLRENRYHYEGMEFIGWCTVPDPEKNASEAVWYSDERVLHKVEFKNMTLFAQWRKVSDSIPYTVLQYIQNEGPSGTSGSADSFKRASIDTGIVASEKYRVWARYNKIDNIATSVLGNGGTYAVVVYGNLIGISSTANNRVSSVGETVGTPIEIDVARYNNLIDASVILNGARTEKLTGVSNALMTPTANNFHLFGWNAGSSGTKSDNGRTRIYGVKIWGQDEKLVRDYIPVMLTSNITASRAWDNKAHTAGELGMWDKCEDKFYSNANGTGYFSNADLQILQFYPNGGTGTMSDQAFFVSAEKNAIKANTFKNGTKRFIGWNTKADGTGTWYYDKYDTNAWKGGVIQLYAMWDNSTYSGISVETVNTDYFEPVNYIYMPGSVGLDTGYSAAAADVYPFTFNARFIEIVKANYTNLVRIMDGVRGFRLYMRNTSSHNYMRVDWYSVQEPSALNTSAINTFRDIKVSVPSTSGNVSINLNGTSASLAPNGANTGLQNSVYFFWSSDGGNLYLKVYGFEMIAGENKGVFVPCRLKRNLTTYNSGSLSFDGKTHRVGEYGFWDLVTNKFMTNANGFTGTFTSEFE